MPGEGKIIMPCQHVHRALSFLCDWLQAKQVNAQEVPSPSPQAQPMWSAPGPGFYKCNIDASFSSELGRTSFGMCISDQNGQLVLAKTDWVPYYLAILEGEATGFLKAIQWVYSLELHHVLFEFDHQQVARRVMEHKEDIS